MFTQLRPARTLCFAGAILTFSSGVFSLTSVTSLALSVGPGSTVNVNNAPFSSAGKVCDPNRDGWVFIMNQLDYPVGSVIDGNDFGPINITFSDGSTGVASFTDLAGGTTAHFLNSTVNQTGDFTITSATMTFPAGTDITGFGNFVISHPPCGTVTTTTTTTTTTVVPTTTTTVAPTTTTTTLVASEAPSTTSTTPTLVASAAPVPPATAEQLPATGNGSGRIVILGLAMFGLGLTLLGLRRRSRPVSS